MVGQGWDWNLVSAMVTASCFWVMNGDKCGQIHTHFSHQDWVCLNWFKHFTAAWPFQCLIIHIINGHTMLRLEYITYTHHCTLTFEWCMKTITFPRSTHLLFTPRSCVFVPIQAIDHSLTLPMSHHEHNEWLDKVEIEIWCLLWSPQAVFESWMGTNVARSTPTFHTKIECVWTDSSISQQLDPSNVSSYI